MAVWSSVELPELSADFRLDSEHYQPEYLQQERFMGRLRRAPLHEAAKISDGNHLSIAEDFVDEGIRYLRGQDLSDFFISDAAPIYIPEHIYKTLARSHMFPGDVLVGIVGTIGSVGLVTKRHGKLTGNCKLAIVRARSLPAEYLAAYLASRVGQNEIRRRIRGAVQMGLILPDLKNIPIIIPPDALKDRVVAAVKAAERNRERCHDLISKAEILMTNSLGLSRLDLSEHIFYEREFADLKTANRFGSEYFMPCKQRVLDALKAKPGRNLNSYYLSVRDLVNAGNFRRDEQVRNFDLSDALNPVLDDSLTPTAANEIGSTKKRVQAGDVVISRLRSYLREIALVRTSSMPAVGSSEFIVLRPREKSSSGLTAETLFVYLRSLPIQTILKWSQDGSQHPRFAEEDLLAIPVPDAIGRIAPRMDALVNESIQTRDEAFRLLDQAKREIEIFVFGKRE